MIVSLGAPSNAMSLELEETLGYTQDPLFPGGPVRNAGHAFELMQVINVPLVIPHQRLLVRVLRVKAKYPFCFLDGDKRIFGGRLVDPAVKRAQA